MANRSGNSPAARVSRALATASYIGKGILPGQGGGGNPINALISRVGNQPILSRSTNETLTARAA